jgi:Mrp family chromosome partitioning ATPase
MQERQAMALLDDREATKQVRDVAPADLDHSSFAAGLEEAYAQNSGLALARAFQPRVLRSWPWQRKVRQEFIESFRLLALSIDRLSTTKPVKLIAVMSERSGEGRTTVAANLALALAVDGRRVVLLDADRRHPRLARLFDVSRQKRGESRDGVAWPRVQAVRDAPRMAVATLASADVRTAVPLLDALRTLTDVTIVDTPPNRGYADAFQLAANVDGVVQVVRRREQDIAAHRSSQEMLDRLGTPILAVVFNAF